MLKKIKKLNKFVYLGLFFASLFLFLVNFENIKIKYAKATKDAVAIRIIPNPKHQSPFSWYQEQGFMGSPQKTVVDGYEAIIDGRTVYANVANTEAGELHTNIYLISYNQAAEQVTTEFFSRLVSNWKFNTNEVWAGVCNDDTDKACVKNTDCDIDDYCTGKKAQIIRDVKRLSDLYEIRQSITVFHEEYGRFPDLKSGSYLQGITISNWPSWKKVLAQTLGLSIPIDPVNRLGPCIDDVSGLVDERFHEVTCWDNKSREFADADLGDSAFNLPENSKTYVYQSFNDGIRYELCAVMESGYVTNIVNGACDGSATYEHSDIHDNRPPVFVSDYGDEEVSAGQAYIHYIKAFDPDGDELTWEIDTSGEVWTGWSSPPELQDIPPIDEKRIFSSQTGGVGNYIYTVIVRDGQGGEARKDIFVRAANMFLPTITRVINQVGVVLYDTSISLTGIFDVGTVVIGHSMNLRVEGEEHDLQYPLSFEFVSSSNTFEEIADFGGNILSASSGLVESDTGTQLMELYVYDVYRGRSVAAVPFNVTVINNPPVILSSTPINLTGCTDHSYHVIASDPDAHDLEYSFANGTEAQFGGTLTIDALTGWWQGTPVVADSGNYSVDISARDEYYPRTNVPYSAEDVQSFTLAVVDENYSVNNVADSIIYNYPDVSGVNIGDYYHQPLTYVEIYGTSATYPDDIRWSGTSLPSGFAVNSVTGVANWTPDNTQDGIIHQIDIEAVNECSVARQESYFLTVLQNEWCGDGIVQGAWGEQCEINCVNCQAVCEAGYQSCSGDPTDADGCECYLQESRLEYCFDNLGDANMKLMLQGDTLVDSSSFSHPINNNGSTIAAVTMFGNGSSMYFDGVSDFLSVNDSDDWDMINSDFTVDAWVRLDSLVNDQIILYQGNGSATEWIFYFDRVNGLSFCAETSAGNFWFNNCSNLSEGDSSEWLVDEWYHVAVVREGDIWNLFRNGTMVATAGEARVNMPNISERIFIAADSANNSNLVGYIDELRISKGVARWSLSLGPDDVPYNGTGSYCFTFVSNLGCF